MGDTPSHAGHRARLRKAIQEKGIESFPDEQVLEYFLFFGIPYKDTLPIAKELLSRFGSFKEVVKASPEELQKVKNMTTNAAMLLTTLPSVYGLKVDEGQPVGPSLGPDNLMPYLRELFAEENNRECLYLISMGQNQELIGADNLTVGDASTVRISIRDVVETALKRKARKVILAHNHPSKNVSPSPTDQKSTTLLNNILDNLDIHLIDHVIVGSERVYSFFLRSEVTASLQSGYLYEFTRLENYLREQSKKDEEE